MRSIHYAQPLKKLSKKQVVNSVSCTTRTDKITMLIRKIILYEQFSNRICKEYKNTIYKIYNIPTQAQNCN